MAARSLEPRNAFVCTEMAAVRALASKGLGIAVIPRSVAEQPGPPIELRPIGPERLTWPIALDLARGAPADAGGEGVPAGRAGARASGRSVRSCGWRRPTDRRKNGC